MREQQRNTDLWQLNVKSSTLAACSIDTTHKYSSFRVKLLITIIIVQVKPSLNPKVKMELLRSRHLREGPDLVGVASGALPDLHDRAVVEAVVREVQAEALVHERNTVVAGVVPGLSCDTADALPDLHLRAVLGCYTEGV